MSFPELYPIHISWHPTDDCPDVEAWLKANKVEAHPGWEIKREGSSFYHVERAN